MNELNRFEREEFLKQLKISWTYTSNAIEGNTISLGDTAFIIEYGLTIKGKTIAEHNEIVGHARAIDLVYELIKKDTIQKENICLLHKAVQTDFIIDIDCPIGDYKVVENGRYINLNNKTKYIPYPSPESVSHLMNLFLKEFGDISKKINSFEECIKTYTDMHTSFSSIHPFFDGNGRLARLIANIPLLKNNFLPIIINNENRQEYIELLSNYNINSKPLDNTTSQLIEEGEFYFKLFDFFKEQYKNAKNILDEIRSKK